MSGKQVEFGIRVSVKDGAAAVSDIKDIGDAAVQTADKVEDAGRAMSTSLQAGAKATRDASEATAALTKASQEAAKAGIGFQQSTQNNVHHTRALEVTAKQTANAMRMLPAQFTDVATQLAGGQNPLLILLQQGGQVKDSFGGIGPMFQGIAAAITPTIAVTATAAAGVAALALAYKSGSAEVDAYNKAIIMSGNVAGTTAGQMQAMAARIDDVVGTQAAAADALAQMAGSGRVAARDLERLSTVALQLERDGGQAVAETVKQFAELGKAPVEASAKLNEQYNYLTVAVYEQIRALRDQGREQEAASLAQNTFAEAMDARTKKLNENLGSIERAWRGIKSAASEAVDAMLSIGRVKGIDEQLKAVTANVDALQAKFDDRQRRGLATGDIARRLAAVKELQDSLRETQRLEERSAAQQADQAATNKAGISASTFLQKLDGEKRGIDRVKDALADYRREVEAYNKANPANPRTDAQIAEDEAFIRKKYTAKGNTSNSAGIANREVAELRALIATQDQLTASLEKYGLQADKVSAGDRKVAAIQAQLALAQRDRTGKLSDAALQEQLVEAQRLAAAEKRNAEMTKSLQLQADISAEVTKWANATQAGQALLDEEAALFGKSAEARRIAAAQLKVDAELRAFLAQQQQKGQQLMPAEIALLTQEAEARKQNIATIEGQRQALAGAEQLRQENRRFAAEAIDNERDRVAALLEIDADMWRERIRLAGDGTEAQKQLQTEFDQWYSNRVNKPMLDESRRAVDQINNDFREGFRNMMNDGRGAWGSFTRSLATTFKTHVADAIYKSLAQPYVVNIATNVVGMLGIGGGSPTAGIASAAANGGVTSLLSAGKTAFDLISGGFQSVFSNLGEVVMNLGNAVGSSSINSFGAGMAGVENAGMAGTLGQAASGLGTMAAGYYAGRAISGGYSLNGGSGNSTVNIGAVAGAVLGGPIGAAIGSIIGGAVNRLFGRKPKEQTSFGFQGNFTDTGFTDGLSFSRWKQKGGVFRSDKEGTDYAALKDDFVATLNDGYKAITDATSGYAKTLGLNAEAIKGYTKGVVIDLTGDQAKDAEILSKVFGDISNEMAGSLIPNFAQFAKRGEDASMVLQHLATNYAAVDAVMATLNRTLGATGIASVEARNRLVELNGGIEGLVAGTSFFAQNFLTEAERIAPVMKSVTSTMAELGLASVDTKEEFKNLVLGLVDSGRVATEEGAKLYAKLMAIAPQFAQVADYTASVIEKAKDSAKSAMESTSMESTFAALFSSLQIGVEEEREAATKRHTSAMAAINEQIGNVTDKVNKLASSASKFRSVAEGMRMPSQLAGDRASAEAQIATALVLARAGNVAPDAEALSNALAILSEPSEHLYESFVDYQRAQLKTANDIKDLADLSEGQLSIEKQTLNAMEGQRAALEANHAAELARLDAMLVKAQQQIDGQTGVRTDIATLAAAIQALANRPGNAPSPSSGGGGTTSVSAVEGLYASILLRPSDPEGLAHWTNALQSGMSIDQIRTEFLNSPEYKAMQNAPGFASGGWHKGGWRKVGERGVELEWTPPSRIFNAQDTVKMLNGVGGADLASEIRLLRAAFEDLMRPAGATATSIETVARLLDLMTGGGRRPVLVEIES